MAHWRDSARNVQFWIVDYRATFPLLLFLLHITWLTFIFAILATIFFAMIDKFGFTPIVFLRWLRSYVAGPRKIAQPWWKN
jgi:intracellular multiplication protein IcmT